MTAIKSGPATGGETVLGNQYNNLREDVLSIHDHTGGGRGPLLDHGNLLNVGTLNHAQIEGELGSINTFLGNSVPWAKIQMGVHRHPDVAGLYTGSKGKVVMPQAMPTNNYLVFLQLHYDNTALATAHPDKGPFFAIAFKAAPTLPGTDDPNPEWATSNQEFFYHIMGAGHKPVTNEWNATGFPGWAPDYPLMWVHWLAVHP